MGSFYNVLEKNGDPFMAELRAVMRSNPSFAKKSALARSSRTGGLYGRGFDSYQEALNELMNGSQKKRWNIPASVNWVMSNNAVFAALTGDFMRPVVDTVAHLLDHTPIKVNVINGNLDLICCTPGTYKWLYNMDWSHKTT